MTTRNPPQWAYDIVAAEIGRGEYVRGLQARAIAESRGDEAKSKAHYITLRALEILTEKENQQASENARLASGPKNQLMKLVWYLTLSVGMIAALFWIFWLIAQALG